MPDMRGNKGDFGGGFSGQSSKNSDRPSRDNVQMSDGAFNINMNDTDVPGNSGLIWLVVSVLVLGIGVMIAKLYKY